MSVLGRNGKLWDGKGQKGTIIFIATVRVINIPGAALLFSL
jgi:hypothetical protein